MSPLAPRVVVAFPPVGEARWPGLGPVGLLRYRDAGHPRIAVAVRVVTPFPAAGEPFLPGEPLPALEASAPPAALPPLRGRELVPYKRACDVGVVGTLIAASDAPPADAASVNVEVRVGDERRLLSLPLAGARVDLAGVTAVALGAGEVRLGPREIDPIAEYAQIDLAEGTEPFQSAGEPLRFAHPEVGTSIALAASFLAVEAALGFEVFLRVDYRDGAVSLPVARCDAVTFDLDRRQVEWVFRGLVHDPSEGRDIERVVVAAFAPGKDEARARVDAWLPHAAWSVAWDVEHVRAAAHPRPLDEEELAMARYSAWDLGPFASTLPIEEVARIQVELVRRKDRAAVLAAHGLTTYGWNVEERAAMERLADAGVSAIDDPDAEGRPPSTDDDLIRYRDAHAEALAEVPFEGRAWSVPDYAELRAALEARNPIRVLERAGLDAAALIGLDQQMEARFEASPAEREEFEARFEEALARLEAEGDGADDFEPPEDEADADEEEG